MDSTQPIPASALREAIDAVRPAIAPADDRACLVYLGNGRIEACRPEIRISIKVPSLAGYSPVCVNHACVAAALRECEGEVQLSAGRSGGVILRGTGGRWSLNVADVAAWPKSIPGMSRPSPVCRLPADQLARCLSGTIGAAFEDPCRIDALGLSGLRIDVLDGTVSFVACDGRRMYVSSAEIDQSVDDVAFSVPAQAVKTVLAFVSKAGSQSVQLVRTLSHAVWTVGSTTVAATILAGGFRQWRKVIPHRSTGHAVVGVAALLAAVRQAEVVTSEDSRAVAFRFTDGRLSLAARSTRYGSASVACPAACADLGAVLRLDPRHVRQWLASLDASASVSMDMGDDASPVLLRHEDFAAVVFQIDTNVEYDFLETTRD
ncbi:DNA polymerase III subunit beta [uncultured Caudovirales phage]|uniref:DNA polymerase III subunit beta n=1 Tax=uncultured Caudovirales phage TaxID=2100421 RepID=A0A6J7X9H3_9CAUD|nr:DNA polymerase III subunit beta [uncultured Caudovirales phage]CAB4176626.1 DNA polymerase III subunit beta [uncultured Caudovirales phage]CAB4181134.1 DNA polymerase III subunit beta [uncultured Caudovirales phage]CAB4198123.1 DNA polymerase III subunit beta [uncultured Caudovirales phage]CAB4210434.1 DNA polymerase III subunit beta [uncultured Caudovirales phage]